MRRGLKPIPGPWLCALVFLAAGQAAGGCGGGGVASRNGGPSTSRDAGSPRSDAGALRLDAAPAHADASSPADRPALDGARPPVDARGPVADAAARDAAPGADARRDAMASRDAGANSHDAGATSHDGPADARTDAGPPPPFALCQIAIHCDKTIPDEPKITCTMSLADAQGVAEFDDHIGIEIHGRSSRSFPKKNYSIELRDATGADKPTDFLQMGKESDWILDGMWADRSLMRNALVLDAFRDLGGRHYGAKGRYCTLSLNDKAQGIYRLEEKIKRDDDRVIIAADDGTGSSFIIKQDSSGAATLSIGEESHWELVYPNQDKATTAQVAGVQSWLNALGTALGSPNDADAGLLKLLDRDATVDWILLEEMMKNIDGYNLSIYFSRDAGGLARLIPWDFDLSLGQPTVQGDKSVPPNDQPGGWIIHQTSLSRALAAVPSVVQQLGPRWRELRAGPLATPALLARLDGYQVTLTADAVAQNFTIWPLAQINYTKTWAPYSLYPVSSYADEVAKLRAFLTARLDWIDAHVDAYPN